MSGVGSVMVALVALAAMLARPARTAPILGPDGRSLPGSVAELVNLTIGGHHQSVMIRGRSVDNPILLYLAGGPGGTDIGAMRFFGERLEQDFVVATWDQRGAGKSYPALDPASTLTVDGMVADTIELTNYLRARFDEEKVYLVGNSWGDDPRGPHRAAPPRPVPRLRGDRPDGERAGDGPHVLRGHPGLG